MKKGYNLLVLDSLKYFIEYPYEEIYLRDFSRRLKISPNSAQRFLNLFLEKGWILEEKKANLRYFKANLDNIAFRYIKKSYSLDKIIDSGLVESLKDRFSSVILFGSVAKGLDDSKSDIDLVCIGKPKEINLEKYESQLGRQINLHIFSFSKWREQKKTNIAFYQDIILDGINLIGEVPLIE